jgi:small GTP-binding protein
MTEAFQYDVFISHSTKDKAAVRELAERLKADGLRVWLDEWEIKPGDMISLKVEQALEQSRTLLLVMSANAFASEWVMLERHTALFRDPTNSQRRFIPLRLDEAEIKDTLKQFAYVDWQTRSNEQYERLLTACRPPVITVKAVVKQKDKTELTKVLKGHAEYVGAVAVMPDLQRAISGSGDNTVRVWDVAAGKCLSILEGHTEPVNGVAVTPDGQHVISGSDDRTARVWHIETGKCLSILEGHTGPVNGVMLLADGQQAVSASNDATVRVWDVAAGKCLNILKGHTEPVNSVAVTPDGQHVISGSKDKTVRVWHMETGSCLYTLKHPDEVWGVAMAATPEGQRVISGSNDATVRVWDMETGRCLATLEGHTAPVNGVAITPDGRRAVSCSDDDTVQVWEIDSNKRPIILEGHTGPVNGVAVTPDGRHAISGSVDKTVRVWDIPSYDKKAIKEKESETKRYINAKVVLVGETTVGKTALGMRLAKGIWHPTHGSTHGMNVWTLYSDEPGREVMLWDFAGQDEYRLVHQLFLNETNVALLLYDPTKSQDTLFGIDYWEKALKNAVPNVAQKILVAARVDVGGVRMSESDLNAYCKRHDYLSHFATSAATNEGCDELRLAIMAAIPWTQLQTTISRAIFKRIKDFLAAVRQGNRILVREPDLHAEFDERASVEGVPSEDEFRTVIGHVETEGLIKRLSFGDFILLKPELLNGYASDIVDAARRHPDGLGAVRKADVLEGNIKIKDEGGLKTTDKIFLLYVTVELLLRGGLALEQDGNLVFPSKFNQRMPQLEEDPVVEVEFGFEGAVENLYTTLVVKLYYGGIFQLKKLWKNAAEFLNAHARVCGFQLHSEGDGRGTLKVFYSEGVSDENKALFLKIIADHFKEKRVEVQRERIYYCPSCREVVRDNNVIHRAIGRNRDRIFCQDCGAPIPLGDALELLYRDDKKFLSQIAAMDTRAEALMERRGEIIAVTAELRTESFKQWAGGADIATVAIVFTDVIDSTKLNVKFGDEGWGDAREAHFAQARTLVKHGQGYLIKTIGDSVMAAFHSAAAALDFALALHRQTGHDSVRIRAGIHIGPVEVDAGDAFGQQVSMAARVEAKAEDGGIWVSTQVKEDIDTLQATKHSQLRWTEHAGEELKGFPRKYTLWSVE